MSSKDWARYKLEDIAVFHDSSRVPLNSREREKRKGKYPYYGASGIVDYIDNYIFDGEYVLISEDGENLRSRQTPIAFKADGKFWVNNHAHVIKGKEPFLNDWVIYFFQNLDINPYITGAVQPKLNKENLQLIEIPLPDFDKAKKIVSILSALDEKIELNRQTNATLEAIAQSIFREWFVEFNFPGATGEMVESELGMIPKGWRVGTLRELYKTTSGGTPSRTRIDFYENGIFQWVKSKELNGSFIIDTEEKINDDALKNSSAKLLPKHSVLIAMYGATVGQLGIISNEATTNQAICAFIPNQDYPFPFIYQFLKNNKDDIISRAVGSAQQNISQELLKNLELVIPDSITMKKYHLIVEPLFLTIEENIKQSATLTSLRDALLPKLMSGEIEV